MSRAGSVASIALLSAVGCVHPSVQDPGDHYSGRITAPQAIPKEFDPVVTASGETTSSKLATESARGPSPEPTLVLDQPLTLEQAEGLAMEHSPRIAEAWWTTNSREAGERVAYSAFLPTFGANYGFQGFTSNTGSVSVPNGGRFPSLPARGFGPGSQDFEVIDLRLQWTVFQFGKRIALHDQAAMRAEIARWQWERTRQTVAFNVAVGYAEVLRARATQVVAERAVVRAEAALKDVRNLASNGVLTNEDVLRAEVFLADVKQGLVTAVCEAKIAVAGLNRVMGINVSTPTRVVEQSPELGEYTVRLEECLAQAVAGRPEFNVVRLGVASAGRGADATRADFLPTVVASGGGAIVEGSRVQNSQVADASIALRWNLYEGGRRRAELRGARAEVEVSLAQGQQVCDTIAYETHVAYRNIEDAIGRLKLARSAVGQATETLRLVRNRYAQGDAKPIDVVDGETALIRAEQNLNTARYDLLIALARMKFATGGASQPGASSPVRPAAEPPAVLPQVEMK